VAQAVSLGGNLEISLGPTSDGRIDNLVQQRLLEMGGWLAPNGEALLDRRRCRRGENGTALAGEAIYGTTRWRTAGGKDSSTTVNISYTARADAVFAIVQGWPASGVVELRDPRPRANASVRLVGRADLGVP
jgi:alpha-L-fucosidase